MIKFLRIFVFILASILALKISAQTASELSKMPDIDGKIDDDEWKDARVFTNFYITVPKSNDKYYDSAIVYIKQSKDALYFAFKFWPKGKVISKSFTRDQSTDEENEFFILLDLENKHDNGYFFSFSFLNNQRDAIIFNQKSMSSEWDWVWQCKSTIYREAKDGKPGYIESEIKIPVDKLQNKNKKTIGIDIQMFAYKPDGTSYFYSIIPESQLLSLRSTYQLDIFPFDEKVNLNFDVSPFVVSNKTNGSNVQAIVGGDLNASLDNHRLKATINTDQSTLEADPYRFTFYNRPVFLSEKRPFFSKDLDIYRTPISLFYTRSIDSIKYGANYTYRSDKLKAGMMFVREPKDTTFKDYFVARPNLTMKDFNLGGLFIFTNDGRTNVQEHIASIDGFYRVPNSRLRFFGQFATNVGDKINGQAFQIYNYYDYNPGGGPFYDLSYNRINKDFQTSTSFNSQIGAPNDFDEVSLSGGYLWKYNRKYISEVNWSGGYYRLRQLSTDFWYQEKGYTELFYRLSDIINLDHYLEYNRPDDFDANGNTFKRNNVDFSNNLKILIGRSALNIGYEWGPYFGSYIRHPYTNLDFVFFDRINLQFAYDYRAVQDIRQSIFSAKLNWRVMPRLFLRSFYQEDTYNQLALWNTLLQYEFFAGSNIYLVMNLVGEKLQNTVWYFKIGYDFNL
jgi:hypothetical protein